MNDPSKTRFVDGKTAPASLIRIVLMHTSTAGEKEVDSVGISGAYDDERIAELAKRFLGKADADAQGLNGRQQYLLYPFYEGTDEPQGRLPFHRNGHIINESGDHSTEPPTPEGRFAQRMRHDEGYSQVLMAATANIINQQNRLIELQGSHLERAKNENVMMFDKLRDMAMQAAKLRQSETPLSLRAPSSSLPPLSTRLRAPRSCHTERPTRPSLRRLRAQSPKTILLRWGPLSVSSPRPLWGLSWIG